MWTYTDMYSQKLADMTGAWDTKWHAWNWAQHLRICLGKLCNIVWSLFIHLPRWCQSDGVHHGGKFDSKKSPWVPTVTPSLVPHSTSRKLVFRSLRFPNYRMGNSLTELLFKFQLICIWCMPNIYRSSILTCCQEWYKEWMKETLPSAEVYNLINILIGCRIN